MLLIVGFVQMSFAQIHLKDSTEAYNYWAKRGVIEVVYAYMNDYIITVGETKAKDEISGKDKYYNEFIIGIDSKENLPAFNEISAILKANSWGGAEKKVFTPLTHSFENKTPLSKNFFNCKKPGSDDLVTTIPGYQNNSENWNTAITKIISKYNETLSEFEKEKLRISSNENSKPVSFENSVPQSEELIQDVSPKRQKKEIPWKSFLIYGSFVLIGFFVGGMLLFLITKNKIKSILEGKYYEYLNAHDNESRFLFGYLSVVFFLHKRKVFYENKTKSNKNVGFDTTNLERKVSQLEREKQVLLDENIELGKKIELLQPKKQSIEPEKNSVKPTSNNSQPQRQLTKAYFSMPSGDGSFQISNGEPLNDGKKYFRIEFEEFSNRGELFYIPSERDQKAINRLESFLKPVCDIENISNASTATKIELIQSGKVSLINDSWVIDTNNKIKIKLY